jgi:uncharacterized membrane protein HdeD (DUF308 family)
MRRSLPPPTKFTIGDRYRMLLGILAIALGATILWRSLLVAVWPLPIAVSAAFIGFGGYRLWLGFKRLKQFRSEGRQS